MALLLHESGALLCGHSSGLDIHTVRRASDVVHPRQVISAFVAHEILGQEFVSLRCICRVQVCY